jgi:hypothetical protein
MLGSGERTVNNEDFFSIDRKNGYPPEPIFEDIMEPDLIAARYTLHPEDRSVVKSEYFIKGSLDDTATAMIL